MPTPVPRPPGPSAAELDRARRDARFGEVDLWIAYVGLGGSCGLSAVRVFLRSDGPLPDGDRRILALAIDERFVDLGRPRPLLGGDDLT